MYKRPHYKPVVSLPLADPFNQDFTDRNSINNEICVVHEM